MSDKNFDFETLREQIEQIKKSLENQRSKSQQVDEEVETNDRWKEQKEAFGKMLDAYDAFLPQSDVASLFGIAADRLEAAAEALKDFKKKAEEAAKQQENNSETEES
mgnify:CR=1 FL=1